MHEDSIVSTNELKDLDFAYIGRLRYDRIKKSFFREFTNLQEHVAAIGTVYIMALADHDDPEYVHVAYVGCSNSNVYNRLSRWQGDLNRGIRSEEGKYNDHKLKQYALTEMQKGYRVYVYARISPMVEVFGQTLSSFKVEEDALIKKYKPTWNSEQSGIRSSGRKKGS
jgi:hypothetical protein